MAKGKEINIKELEKEICKIDGNKQKLALSLLDKAEFLEEVLQKLKIKVQIDGVVTEMCQGEYSIDRENPALKSYNTTIKNYASIIKQLNDMLPVEKEKDKTDGFEEFGADD